MSKYNFAAIILIAACIRETAAVAQQNRGTPEQQAACAPDAFRFCGSYIPLIPPRLKVVCGKEIRI